PNAELPVREFADCLGNDNGPDCKSTYLLGPNVLTKRRLNSPSPAKRTQFQYPNLFITISLRNIIEDIFGKINFPGVPRRENCKDSSSNLACSDVFATTSGFSCKCFTCVSIFCSCDQSSASLIVIYLPVACCKPIFLATYGPLFFSV